MITRTATIPTHVIPAVRAKVAQLNARAAKLGVEGLRLEVGEAHLVPADTDPFAKVEVAQVTLHGVSPRLPGGWRIAARVDHSLDLPIVNASPVGEEMDLSAYRDREPACDHCGIDRDRKQVYVLVNDEGEIKQVGSTCLKDFVGHADALRAADWAEAAAELLDDESFQDRSVRLYDLAAVLRVASAVIREEGWVSRSVASRTGKSATADHVVAVIHGKAKVEVTDEDSQLAEDAIAWARHLQDVDNDYLFNLHSLAVSEAIAFRHIALATSMISAFQRHLEAVAARESKAVVPAPSGRVEVEGEVVSVKFYDNSFGPGSVKKLLVQATEGYRVFVTCPASIREVERGQKVRMVANLSPKAEDPTFAYGKRPSKAEIIS